MKAARCEHYITKPHAAPMRGNQTLRYAAMNTGGMVLFPVKRTMPEEFVY